MRAVEKIQKTSRRHFGGWVLLALILTCASCGVETPQRPATDADTEQDAAVGDADTEPRKARPSHAAEWVYVEAKTFKVGSPPYELGRLPIETQHEVELTTDYLIQPTEVTQRQFRELMGYNPSHFTKCGDDCPVEDVSWHEAAAYCNALSKSENLYPCYSCSGEGPAVKCQRNGVFESLFACPGYRLPGEAEWEHAARAGDLRPTYNGHLSAKQLECESPNPVLDPIAWYCGNSGGTPHPVGQKEPNGLGLYDMLGNVWEWNHDWDYAYPNEKIVDPWGPINGVSRIGHGGSWVNKGRLVRFAARGGGTPDRGYGYIGFRPVRSCIGEEMDSLCRHRYAFRWARSADAAGDASADGDSEAGAAPSTSGADAGNSSEDRDAALSERSRNNGLILLIVVVAVLALFGAERLYRRFRRR